GGVEPICRVLTEHGCSIAPSTYYAHRKRVASALRLTSLVTRPAEICGIRGQVTRPFSTLRDVE
ncbi:hypothetical protein ACIRYZ_23050, partial [Kitasatospora sp. NPDC101155]|uniref:hypothetical protein n=1 Tax=Kitasatospora sp. NPDC101155 TaxID=3364097 RepID=UPI00380FCCD9